MIKKADILLIGVPVLVLALGILLRLNYGSDWNTWENLTDANKVFTGLQYFINTHNDDGFPEKREIKEFTRKNVPYIMIYFSRRENDYQAAFWDFEYTWVYDSESGKIYRMTEDMSTTVWYDSENHKLLSADKVNLTNSYKL